MSNEPINEEINKINVPKSVDPLKPVEPLKPVDPLKPIPIDPPKTDVSSIKEKVKYELLNDCVYLRSKETINALWTDNKFYAKVLGWIRIMKIMFAGIVVPGLLLTDTQFRDYYFNYVAGLASLTVSCLEVSDKLIVQSNKKRAIKVNDILESMGIDEKIVDMTIDVPTR